MAREKLNNTADTKKSVDKKAIEAENRRKSDTRFWFRLISIVIIIPVYLTLVVCMLVLPRSTVSNIEKRELATFPEFSWGSYWSGEYTASIANYYDDTVPFRDELKQTASKLLSFLGIKYNDVQVSGQMVVVNNGDSDATASKAEEKEDVVSQSGTASENNTTSKKDTDTDKATDTDTDTATDTDSEEPKGQEIADGVYTNGQIVIYMDGHYRAMSMFGGGSGDAYVNSLNNFASDLPGVRVYSMVVPTPSEFYTPEKFNAYNASQSDCITSINSRLSGVTGIDPCPVLEEHKKEAIYTRTDHHWMSLGAYYAAQTFAKSAGVPFKSLSDYEKVSIDGYVGTMYTFTGNNADLLNDPEEFFYYKPKNSYTTEYYTQGYGYVYQGELLQNIGDLTSLYMTYMGGDGYVTKITTDVTNGRKLCVVKDSYGNAEIPFYVNSFSEIYVVDMRYFELNLVDFVKQQGITDLLFTMCSYSAVGTNANNLETLRTRVIETPEPEPEVSSEETIQEEVSSEGEWTDESYTDETYTDETYTDETYTESSYEDTYYDDTGYTDGGYDTGYTDDGYTGEYY